MKSERWNEEKEIIRKYPSATDSSSRAGPNVYYSKKHGLFSDTRESHCAAIGLTGSGKSQCCSLPFFRNCIEHKESIICLDPKGECFQKNDCYITDDYQKFVLDFRSPRNSPTKWSPLAAPLTLFRSDCPENRDIASSMISELWASVYPYDSNVDRFWPESSINFARGLTYFLFEYAPPEQINLDSIAVMMEESETKYKCSFLLKELYDLLPCKSLSKRNLATYCTAPNETRASIHSVASSGLEVFSRSNGLMSMLAQDTLNILEIDIERPFVCIIITPDETDTYDTLAGLLISQLTQHLIRVAQERGGKLPIRVNLILEELGSVGKAIPNLPNLMVAGRSRNLRILLVLQSLSQLEDVYGKSKAETIRSCIGTTILFSTNCWQTLQEFSQRCGEREIESHGRLIHEPLITPAQLAAMSTGTALVLAENRYKFISHFPLYNDAYDNSNWKPPINNKISGDSPIETIDLKKLVLFLQEKNLDRMIRLGNDREESKTKADPFNFGIWHDVLPDSSTKKPPELERLAKEIERKIGVIEADESKRGRKKKNNKKDSED